MLWLLRLLPKNLVSWYAGRLSFRRKPEWLARLLKQMFLKFYPVDGSESAEPLESYQSLGELFVRDLKPGARPIYEGVVSPVDGVVTQCGTLFGDEMIQAKGISYSLYDLVGRREIARPFENGSYLTIYLAPPDYHHVHSPLAGTIRQTVHIPGALWPVNAESVLAVPKLFCLNERVVTLLDTECGVLGVVCVGATNVGSIALSYDSLVTNAARRFRAPAARAELLRHEPGIAVQKGERLASFRLGSTVIVLFQQAVFFPAINEVPVRIRMGEPIGEYRKLQLRG